MPTLILRSLLVAALLACPDACAALGTATDPDDVPVAPAPTVPRFDFRNEDLVLLACSGALAVICKQIEDDEEMSEHLDRPYLESISDAGNLYGSGATLGGAAAAMMGLGRLAGDERLAATGDDLLRALVVAWIPVWSAKPILDVRRPNGGRYSFPSGHTATAFAAAPVFAHHGGRVLGVLAHGAAAATALGRMEDSKHHAADVLVGAAIGLIAGRLAVRARVARTAADRGDGFAVSAAPGGIACRLRF